MDFKDILSKRRSIRKYNDLAVDPEVIQRVVDATLAAPSSRNSRTTHLLVITDRDIIIQIAKMRDYGSAFVEQAPVFVLVMGDTSASDLWEVNCSISATTMLYAATSEGLASCWVHIKDRPQKQSEPNGKMSIELVRSLVDIPENLDVLCGVALGHSDFAPAALPPFDKESKCRIL